MGHALSPFHPYPLAPHDILSLDVPLPIYCQQNHSFGHNSDLQIKVTDLSTTYPEGLGWGRRQEPRPKGRRRKRSGRSSWLLLLDGLKVLKCCVCTMPQSSFTPQTKGHEDEGSRKYVDVREFLDLSLCSRI